MVRRFGLYGEDVGLQRVGELALLLDAGEHCGAPLLQLAQVAQALFQCAQLGVVERTGDFLAIASDKRNGRAFIEQRHRRLDLLPPDTEFPGDFLNYGSHLPCRKE